MTQFRLLTYMRCVAPATTQAQLFFTSHDPLIPCGARGMRTLLMATSSPEQVQLAEQIPGVVQAPGGVAFAWDALPAVCRIFGAAPPQLQITPVFPGAAEFQAKGLHNVLRPYQVQMLGHLAARAMAINGDPPRSGKTVTMMGAAVAVGAKKVLIICPSIAKFVWASEIAKWLKEDALILEGRAAEASRVFCWTCDGLGVVGNVRCARCTRGWIAVSKTNEDAQALIRDSRWVIVNYDLLVGQRAKDASGKVVTREDLPGWAPTLARHRFDISIGDEGHLLRGRATYERRGLTRRDRFLEAVRMIPRVWLATGTPLYGRTADMWGLLDAATGGLFGMRSFPFDVRYCTGHKGKYGWTNSQDSNIPELQERLSSIMLKRTRKEISPDLPPKTRQVIYLESPSRLREAKGVAEALRASAELKAPLIVDGVLEDVLAGEKAIVFTYLRSNADKIVAELKDRLKAKDLAPRARAAKLEIFVASGEQTNEQRFRIAESFRNWSGAAIMVATIDSMQVALSLNGASTVHFADLHYDPSAMLQAEDRPYEMGSAVHVIYYILRGAIDERVLSVVLPKMKTLESVVNEQGATDFRAAFLGQKETPEQIAAAIWARSMQMQDLL